MGRSSTDLKRHNIDGYGTKKRLISERGGTCCLCNKNSDQIVMDHIVPLWQGGSNEDSNLQLICYECHSKKTRKEQTEYARLHPVVVIKDGVVVPGKGKYNGQ